MKSDTKVVETSNQNDQM